MEHQPRVDLSFTWSSVLAYDTTVFALTLYRALGVDSRWRGNILSILLRDGELFKCGLRMDRQLTLAWLNPRRVLLCVRGPAFDFDEAQQLIIYIYPNLLL